MLSSDNSKVWFVAHKSVFRAAKHLGQIHSEVVLPIKERHSLTKDFRSSGRVVSPLAAGRSSTDEFILQSCNLVLLKYW